MTIQQWDPNSLWQKVDQGPLTQDDYERLKDSMPSYSYLLIVKLLRCTGLRISELLSITPSQKMRVGASHCIVVKRSKKRGNEEDKLDAIFIHPEMGIELDSYIKDHFRKHTEPIFQGNKLGLRLTNRALEYVFRQASEKIERKVTPHMLRSFFSNYLMDNGVPVDVASKMLGHNNVKTTLEHYRQLTMDTRQRIGEAIRP